MQRISCLDTNPLAIKGLMQALGHLRAPCVILYSPYHTMFCKKVLDVVQKLGLDKTYGYKIPRLANSA